jgi:hypothetical protein
MKDWDVTRDRRAGRDGQLRRARPHRQRHGASDLTGASLDVNGGNFMA